MARAAPEHLLDTLQAREVLAACPELNTASRLWVAFSGGLDSTVLLHLVSMARKQGLLTMPVQAIHIHHGLQAAADAWERHCSEVCKTLDVALTAVRVQVDCNAGRSIEEAARQARHRAFATHMQAGELLLLAHHQDDQIETVLFRLLRGSGAAGMAGMPRSRPCGEAVLLRPLLAYPRAMLVAYANHHALAWIEDASNQQQRYDRNFLRAAVIPPLREHWPGLSAAVSRSARLSGEAAQLLDELAALDLQACIGTHRNRLRIAELLKLSEIRQRNLLRFWLQGLQAVLGLAPATHQALHRGVSEVVLAAQDAEPELLWGQGAGAAQLRRYRGILYALPILPDPPAALVWDGRAALQLPAPLGKLALAGCTDAAVELREAVTFDVRFRRGGERVVSKGRPTRSLKKFLQENAVPPWLRERIPLVYIDNELVAVGDIPVNAHLLPKQGEKPCCLLWLRPDLDCGY